MQLTTDEKKILNSIFKEVKGTTRNTMLMAIYAAKPTDDGSPDSKSMITLINGLIIKLSQASREEMETLFNGIPYEI
ncbi:MAG: hypothetical protein ACRCU3_03545 [Eubacteriaceae bacterium]